MRDVYFSVALAASILIGTSINSNGSETTVGQRFLDQAYQAASNIQDTRARAEAFHAIAVEQAEQGYIVEALQTAKTIEIETVKDHAVRLIAGVQAKQDVQAALSITGNITIVTEREKALQEIALVQANAGDMKGAFVTVETVKDRFIQEDTLHGIAVAQAKAGSIKAALKTANAIKNETIMLRTLESIAVLRAKSGDFKGAMRAANNIKNEIGKFGVLGDIAALRVKTGSLKEANKIASSIPDEAARDDVLRRIAVAQAETSDFGSALKTIASLQYDETREHSLHDVAVIQAISGDVKGALETAGGLSPSGTVKSETFRDIAVAQANAGDIKGAQETIDSIPSKMDREYALRRLAVAQAKAGDMNGARETLDSINEELIKEDALPGIAAARAQVGDVDTASQLSSKLTAIQASNFFVKTSKSLVRGEDDINTSIIRVPVFFATNRNFIESLQQYGSERRDKLLFGISEVPIRKDLKMGMLDSSSFWRTVLIKEDANPIVTISGPMVYNDFFNQLRSGLDPKRKEGIIFIHGFGTSLKEASQRTAQIAYDLGLQFTPILYSWPSQGKITPVAYLHDHESARASGKYFKQFLLDLIGNSGLQRINIVAHSMGSEVLLEALTGIRLQNLQGKAKLHDVVFSAPDMDAGIFKDKLSEIQLNGHAGARVTLYVSRKDKALSFSQKGQGSRAGYTNNGSPLIAKGIDTIDASELETDFWGHSYYAENKSVLSDMFHLFRCGLPPDHRFGLKREKGYWIFRR